MNLLLAVQASSQFDTVYGSAYANELRDIFPAALILFGAPEMEMLRRAEEWSLQTTRRSESFDQASGAKTLSSHTDSTLDYRRLLPANRDKGRLLVRGTPGVETELLDWSQFVPLYDEQVKRFIAARSGHGRASTAGRQSVWERLAARHHKAMVSARGTR